MMHYFKTTNVKLASKGLGINNLQKLDKSYKWRLAIVYTMLEDSIKVDIFTFSFN